MVIHVLADGRRVDSIAGHVIKQNEFKALYRIIDAINSKGGKDGTIPISEKRN